MPHASDRKPGDVPTQEERETNPVGSSEEEASSNIPPRPSDHPTPTRCDARASRLARQAATNETKRCSYPALALRAQSSSQPPAEPKCDARPHDQPPSSGELRLLTIKVVKSRDVV